MPPLGQLQRAFDGVELENDDIVAAGGEVGALESRPLGDGFAAGEGEGRAGGAAAELGVGGVADVDDQVGHLKVGCGNHSDMFIRLRDAALGFADDGGAPLLLVLRGPHPRELHDDNGELGVARGVTNPGDQAPSGDQAPEVLHIVAGAGDGVGVALALIPDEAGDLGSVAPRLVHLTF